MLPPPSAASSPKAPRKFRGRALTIAAALALLGIARAYALGPHELALLVNANSLASREVANQYARLRRIPECNIIEVHLPDSVRSARAEISPDDFNRLIWQPANAELAKRKLADHILAWAYSCDFPVRIQTDPPMSLHGLTFLRGVVPEAEAVRKGTYRSPVFAGPDRPDSPMGQPVSLERLAAMFQRNMPMPSMSLGVTGSRGQSIDEILACLQYGAIADGSKPNGRVCFVTNQDVRTEARIWQFPIAAKELKASGVGVDFEAAPPAADRSLVGIMLGLAVIDPPRYGHYLPGAIGDNLTSFAAAFDWPDQTKLTAWLRAGTVAASGTVAEPYAIWTKFPNARLFSHYARGCTVLESYYAAVRCPLQLFIVGDPLCAPWAEAQPLTLVCTADDTDAATGKVDFAVTSFGGPESTPREFLYLLDGRSLNVTATQGMISVETSALNDGWHELRAVGYTRGEVRHQSFAESGFTTRNHNREIRILSPHPKSEIDLTHPLDVEVSADGTPTQFAIEYQERIIARAAATSNKVIAIDPQLLGVGPATLQAIALYEDQEAVRSKPVPVTVKHLNQPPVIGGIRTTTNEVQRVALVADATDPQGDPIDVTWWLPVREAVSADQATATWNGDQCTIAGGERALFRLPLPSNGSPCRISFDVMTPAANSYAGVGFAFTNATDCAFWGLSGEDSSWTVGQISTGRMERLQSRGAYLKPNSWHTVELDEVSGTSIVVRADGERIVSLSGASLSGSPIALITGTGQNLFRSIRVSLPKSPDQSFDLSNWPTSANQGLVVTASDGIDFSEQPVPSR